MSQRNAHCPVDGKRYDADTSYDGKTLPVRLRRGYCSRACARAAMQQRRDAASSDQLADILGRERVAEVIEAARESGQPVVIEGLPPARRSGGLGRLGDTRDRWADVDTPSAPRRSR